MELSPKQQFNLLIKKSKRILILTHINPEGDALGSTLALYLVLKNLDKEVTAVCQDPIPETFKFLPTISQIKQDFSGNKDFIVTIDISKVKPEKLKYKLEDNKLNIIITPKNGQFKPEDVSFEEGKYNYDLIIVLDCSNLDQIGKIYDKYVDLFYGVPIINIDHHATNEYFGKVNIVDLTATSVAEILVSLIESINPKFIDADIATCLLAGIITDTNSFKNSNTTPKSLTIAAQLVASGARQQEIIQHVYRTKPLSQLKLWGLILSKIQFDPQYKIAWSVVSQEDLKKVGAHKDQTSGVIDELISGTPNADIILLITEKEPGLIVGSIRTTTNVDAVEIAKLFNGGGHPRAAGFRIEDKSLSEAEKIILEKIRNYREGK